MVGQAASSKMNSIARSAVTTSQKLLMTSTMGLLFSKVFGIVFQCKYCKHWFFYGQTGEINISHSNIKVLDKNDNDKGEAECLSCFYGF